MTIPYRAVSISLMLLFSYAQVYAQVSDDFEGSEPLLWYSEGDGTSGLEEGFGNPGNSFRVNDDASGDVNFAIAPEKYLGDWSHVTAADFISVDYFVGMPDGDTIVRDSPVFQLVGPGGNATVLSGADIPWNEWTKVKVPLDSTLWIMESGNWSELLSSVDLLRVRAEWVNGEEVVFLDNIKLSFSPLNNSIEDSVCSDFEDETFEGWHFEETGSIDISLQHGNPGLGLGISDAEVVISQAIAPGKFLGNWSDLPDSSYLKFDLYIDNFTGGGLYNKQYLIKISGGEASAQVLPPTEELQEAIGNWKEYRFYLLPERWTLTSGSWETLMENVEEIRVELEYINDLERASFDNFCLIVPNEVSGTQTPVERARFLVYPNPCQGSFTIEHSSSPISQVKIYTAAGRLLQVSYPNVLEQTMSIHSVGTHLLEIQAGGELYRKKLIVVR